MDAVHSLAFLCHPLKDTPTCKVLRFIGFEFDTISAKFHLLNVKDFVMVEYLLSTAPDQDFYDCPLAVSTSILQSLVEATPSCIGTTFYVPILMFTTLLA